jgi:hypothetical protein
MQKLDYTAIPEEYLENTIDVLEDIIEAFEVTARVLGVDPKLIIAFSAEYLSNYNKDENE